MTQINQLKDELYSVKDLLLKHITSIPPHHPNPPNSALPTENVTIRSQPSDDVASMDHEMDLNESFASVESVIPDVPFQQALN